MPSISVGPNISSTSQILDGAIMNADINASAAIDYSKLNLALGILNGDISASAAIALSKLANGTRGDILYRTAGGVTTALGAGTAGLVLTTQGTGADPTWASAGGGTAGQQTVASSVTGTTVFAHGLGRAPTAISFMCFPTATIAGVSCGTWKTGTNGQAGCFFNSQSVSTTSGAILIGDDPVSYRNIGAISVDATNITITWTKTGAPSVTWQLNWFAV